MAVPVLVLGPYRGEFGLKVRFWVPQVHAACQQTRCLVRYEEGEDALFPGAAERVIEEVDYTHAGRAARGRPPDLGYGVSRFVPEPFIPQPVFLPDYATVVVCPRWSDYGVAKNWDGWPILTELLEENLVPTFAAGTEATSYHVPSHDRAWDYERPLDATIQAMKEAALVVATDAGLAHLAVLCGAPLLLVTHEGRVAPGPVVNSSGRVARERYWPVRWKEYYTAANHTGALMTRIDGWGRPDRVARAVEGLLS